MSVALSAETLEALDELAGELELADRLRPLDALRWRELDDAADGPNLQLEDVSAIPFLDDITGVELYQQRARVRARDGDLFAAVTATTEGYEDYCRDLGLGSPELVRPEPVGHPLEVARACAAGHAFDRIVTVARDAGRLIVHPYMAIEPVWELARQVGEAARVPVTVIGPPPAVTWVANDKVVFSRVVEIVLEAGFLPDQVAVETPSAAAAELARLAARHERVGLKRARCASAMGNRVFRSEDLGRGDPERSRLAAEQFAADTRWPADEGAIATEWIHTLVSPSTQLWLPPRGHGEVRLDGIYEQILAGDTKVFVGSRPSRLPARLNQRIGDAARTVATALQHLGYTGRCSFDHLIVGDPTAEPRIVFTECNGRWGGTSTPMSLVDRLIGAPRPIYRAQDVVREGLVGAKFADVRAALGTELYSPHRRRGRYILYNVGPLLDHGKIDVIALADTPAEADEAMLETLPRLLGL